MAFETALPILKDALQVPGLLKEIYTDALKPGVSQVGKALGTVLGLGNTILLPLYLLNERTKLTIEKNLEKYRASLKDVPADEIVPVAPEVGVPIVEKLVYVSDDNLSDLYITLLSKASTAPTAGQAHPGFVHILNSLSPDEALLLKAIHARNVLPFITTIVQADDGAFNIVKDLYTALEDQIDFAFRENVEAYLFNLAGHGILTIRRDVLVADLSLYEKLEADARRKSEGTRWYKNKPEGWSLAFHRGDIQITRLGYLFLRACLKKLGE